MSLRPTTRVASEVGWAGGGNLILSYRRNGLENCKMESRIATHVTMPLAALLMPSDYKALPGFPTIREREEIAAKS